MRPITPHITILLLAISSTAFAFTPQAISRRTTNICSISNNNESHSSSRADFLTTTTTSLLTTLTFLPSSANARGRATLEQTYERYTPRIITGGKFYAADLKKIIASNDWKALKAATSDPPKKTKEDRAKVDGGVAERASQAGGFSDARVLVAMDLYAAGFSDSSFTAKTKKLQGKVEELRKVVQGMNSAAKQALGEEDGGGGFFGLGKKKVSEKELAQTVRQLYVEGGNKWNEYVYEANDGLAVQFNKLPYL